MTEDTRATAPDLNAIKLRQQQTWAAGDYGAVGMILQITSEELCEAIDLRPGASVLDVATGSGNTAIAAARRFCQVTGLDYVPALLERGRQRAAAESVRVSFQEGDAEKLPFADGSFDYVVSTFGVMFAPDQERAASELVRVCRPGGTIGLVNWTPDGFAGAIFAANARWVAPPPGLQPPTRWGTEEGVRALLGDAASSLTMTRRAFVFRMPSPQYYVDFFRANFGPTVKTFEALDASQQKGYEADLLATIARYNRAQDGSMVVPSDYLEIVATKR